MLRSTAVTPLALPGMACAWANCRLLQRRERSSSSCVNRPKTSASLVSAGTCADASKLTSLATTATTRAKQSLSWNAVLTKAAMLRLHASLDGDRATRTKALLLLLAPQRHSYRKLHRSSAVLVPVLQSLFKHRCVTAAPHTCHLVAHLSVLVL